MKLCEAGEGHGNMKMQKEEKIVVVLLLMALGSLAVAFWAFAADEGASPALSNSPNVGASTDYSSKGGTLQGQVLEMKTTKSGGNLILRLDSTNLPIFVPSSVGAEEIKKKIQPGDKIQVKGSVSNYQGEKELKVTQAADIRKV